jgi:hypothetical protein
MSTMHYRESKQNNPVKFNHKVSIVHLTQGHVGFAQKYTPSCLMINYEPFGNNEFKHNLIMFITFSKTHA